MFKVFKMFIFMIWIEDEQVGNWRRGGDERVFSKMAKMAKAAKFMR
jgi:hypothetical protein